MKKNYIFLLVVIIIFSAFPRVANSGNYGPCTSFECENSSCAANCSPSSGVCKDYGSCKAWCSNWNGWRWVTSECTVVGTVKCFCTNANPGNCPSWGSWGDCRPEAGKWYETRFCLQDRTIYQIRQCVPNQGDTGNGNGNAPPPPPVCVPSWGACSVFCGGGTQTDGCGNTRDCNTQRCPPAITDFYIAKSLINMDHNATETMNQQTGIPFYIVLAMQMSIRKLPINWSSSNADTCVASCTYTDKQGNRFSDDGQGQLHDCQFRGDVGTTRVLHNAFQVNPQQQGIVTYTLTCSNSNGDSDTKTFQVGVKLFSWREVLRDIHNAASQLTTDTHFGFASMLDAIKAKLLPAR